MSKKSFAKGKLGEEQVDQYLEKMGYIPYRPDEGRAHPFDRLVASPDKRTIFVAEAKTKPHRLRYPDTGIDRRHYDEYCYLRGKYNINIFLFFVDEYKKKIYGGFLHDLEKEIVIEHYGKNLVYPLEQKGIIYFPLELMTDIANLDDNVVKELKKKSTRSASYDEEYQARSGEWIL